MTLMVGLGLAVMASSASADETAPESDEAIKEAIATYCKGIADKASEQRAARQKQVLTELQGKVEAKIAELENRTADLKGWVEKQQQLASAAERSLVDIYGGMEPEVAARQIAALDSVLASSLLRQLKPKQASAILNEMKPEQAGPLVRAIGLSIATKAPGK